MDLRALIAKMDKIESKKILNERKDERGTVTKTKTGVIHKAGPKGYGNKWDGDKQDQAPAKVSKAGLSSAEKKAQRAKDIKLPPWKGNVTKHSSNKGAEKDDGTGDEPKKSNSKVNEGAKEAHDAHEKNMDAAQREMDSREAEGEDMSNHVIDTETYEIVKKKQKQQKKVNENFNFKGSIAKALLKEFGIDEETVVTTPPGAPAYARDTTIDGKTGNETSNPWTNDPAKSAAWAALSPADQKWLGGGDPTDTAILARAPNKGQPQPAQAMPTAPDESDAGKARLARQNTAASPAAAPAAPAAVPTGINPETGEPYDSGTSSQLQLPPGAEAEPGISVAGGATTSQSGQPAPAKPAAAAPNKSMTPAVTAYAASMGLLKGGKPDIAAIKKFQKEQGLKDDGIIGPNTAGAIISAQKPGSAGSGRGGQGGPTAAQLAGAAKPAAGAAPPTASPNPVTDPEGYKKMINARLMAKAQADAAKAAKPLGQISDTPAAESVQRTEDNQVLNLIRNAFKR